jgi:hypothetical protein
MAYKTVRLKREELYEQVWSRPLRDLAKEYGLSDVGLAKICRRLNIPVPGRGYWAKKDVGRTPSRPPLPSLGKNEQSEAVFTKHEPPPPDPEQLTEADRLIISEKTPENRVAVDPSLNTPHVLVIRTEKSLRAAKPDETGRIRPRAKGCFDVRIAAGSIDRAMRILDALAKALETRKFPLVTDDEQTTRITVLGISHEISLEENTTRKVRGLTPAERKQQERNPWLYSTPQYDYLATGRLTLRIRGYGNGERRSWSDGKHQRIEDCLNAFIIGLIQLSVRAHAEQLERERWQREREEQERRRREEERNRQLEEARRAALDTQVDAWRKSRQIRAYIEAVHREVADKHGPISPESDLGRWFAWVSRYVDSLDPLCGDLKKLRLIEGEETMWRAPAYRC